MNNADRARIAVGIVIIVFGLAFLIWWAEGRFIQGQQGPFDTLEAAKAWVEEQLGVEPDDTAELNEKLVDAERVLELVVRHFLTAQGMSKQEAYMILQEEVDVWLRLAREERLAKAKAEREGGTG